MKITRLFLLFTAFFLFAGVDECGLFGPSEEAGNPSESSQGGYGQLPVAPNPQCGNGVVGDSQGEECDDGNNEGGDGCTAVCTDGGKISDGAPLNQVVRYNIYRKDISSDGIGLNLEQLGAKNFLFTVSGLNRVNKGNVEIRELEPGYELDESNFYMYPVIVDRNFAAGENEVELNVTLSQSLCFYPTERHYIAAVYSSVGQILWSDRVVVSVAANKVSAVYQETNARVGDILYCDGNVMGVGHAAIYYGKDKDGNDLVIESNKVMNACGEYFEGVTISFARTSLNNNYWYGAYYSDNGDVIVHPDDLIRDAECQLGSKYDFDDVYPASSCGSGDGAFRCDTFSKYLYERQGVLLDVLGPDMPVRQRFDDDLEERSVWYMSTGVTTYSQITACSDGTNLDLNGDACNHYDCTDFSAHDGVAQNCKHCDCFDGSLRDPIADPCNHADCLDRTSRDEFGDACDHDDDDDGVSDGNDNCPFVANADQMNNDDDDLGNACDEDDDNDSILDSADNCQYAANADQADLDGDGIGNACEGDTDGDGVPDSNDNCAGLPNASQTNADGDNMGDACDSDDDNDGILDVNDNCRVNANASQDDYDKDGTGDACDSDDDGDGISDSNDSCPLDPYHDSVGNPCDHDEDKDGVTDALDCAPYNPAESSDTDRDGVCNGADSDDDNDGMPDSWEATYGLDPLTNDAVGNLDGDHYSNMREYQNNTNPSDKCSPIYYELCVNYVQNDGYSDCGRSRGGAYGEHCVPYWEWTPAMMLETDGLGAGCRQQFQIKGECLVDLTFCVDFHVQDGGDAYQCGNPGHHCVGANTWTPPIVINTDNRSGGCNQQFFLSGPAGYSFELSYWADPDAGAQCKGTGASIASTYPSTATTDIIIDPTELYGACWQQFRLRNEPPNEYGPDM